MDLNMSHIKQEIKKEHGVEDYHSTDCSEVSRLECSHNADNMQSTNSKERMANKAAERSRLYRQRHRDKINEHRRMVRQKKLLQKNSKESNHITERKSNSKSILLLEREERYYERHIAEINNDIEDIRQKQNLTQQVPTTSTEHNCKYRERNRTEINERRRHKRQCQKYFQPVNVECILRTTNSNDDGIITNVPHNFDSSDNMQSTDSKERMAEKAAERSRLYRQRHREKINEQRRRNRQKKLLERQNIESKKEIIEIKSNRKSILRLERQRRYYERHKEEINKSKREMRRKLNLLQPVASTSAERNRRYRERNRKEINERRRHSRHFQKHFMPIDVECIISTTNSSEDDVSQNMSQNTHVEESKNDESQV